MGGRGGRQGREVEEGGKGWREGGVLEREAEGR